MSAPREGAARGTPPATRGALWATACALAALVAIGLDPFLDAVVALGRYMPPHDIASDYATSLLWAFVLGLTILVWPVRSSDRVPLALIWAAKVAVTLGFMLLYEWNFPLLDAWAYYGAAAEPSLDSSGAGIGGGTELTIALTWLHTRLLPGSYHAAKVTFAMCGLVAVYVFYRAAVVAAGRERLGLLLGLALFPSILFWSSILGKDPVILLGIAVYAYGVVSWDRKGGARYLACAIAGLALAASFRLWLAPILAAPLGVTAVLRARGAVPRAAWLAGGGILVAVAMRVFWQRFAIETIGDLLSAANYWSQGWAEGGSAQVLSGEFTGIGSMLAFLPLGMFTALFRPLPGEVMNAFGLLAGLENAFVLGLLALALARTRWRDLRDPLVLWAVLVVLTWSSVYSFVSYQNLGTAVRFRLQILPILLLLLLHLAARRSADAPGGAGAGRRQ
jgi:hypothetical protein